MLKNDIFVLDCYEKQVIACVAETKTQAMHDAELWHTRFGNMNYGSLMILQQRKMVQNMYVLEMPSRHVCEGCVLGKIHRFDFPKDGSIRATQEL